MATSTRSRHRRRTAFFLVVAVVVLTVAAAFALGGFGPWAGGRDVSTASNPPADAERARRAGSSQELSSTNYPIPAGSLYVAPNGDDSAPGTAASPLRTAKAAIARATNGAAIVLRAGVYREDLGLIRSPVTLQPYPGERVWFSGDDVVTGWTRDGDAWRHSGWRSTLCQTCHLKEIIDPAWPLAGSPDMVFLNDRPLRQVAERNQVEPGTFWVDRATHALFIGSEPKGQVTASVRNRFAQLDPGAAGSVIRGIGVRRYATNQDYGNRPAMLIVNAPRVMVENATFSQSASTGALITRPDVVVRGSTFSHNGLVGLLANKAHRLTVTGATMIGNNAERFATSGPAVGAAGVKITHTDRPTVNDSVARDNFANGIWCDLGCADGVFTGNLATGNRGSGLFYEVSTRAKITSNVSAGNDGHGIKIASADKVTLSTNTLAGNRINVGIYNDPRESTTDGYSGQRNQPWVSTGTVLRGNLFTGTLNLGGPPAAKIVTTAFLITADYKKPPRMSAAEMVTISDGNAFLSTGSEILASWWRAPGDVREFRTLADFRAATGREKTSVALTGSPNALFADPAKGKFRLNPSAPAKARIRGAQSGAGIN